MSKSKLPLIALVVLVALAGLGFGGYRLNIANGVSSRAADEDRAEVAERKICKDNLAQFYKAWKQYRADHKGSDPPTVQAMFPKYLSNVSILECPTAVRLDKKGLRLDRGGFELDRQNVDVTYGFRWMAAGFSKQVQKQGDKIPLVICKCHQQAIYLMAYRKPAKELSFDDEERAKLSAEVASAPILGVRRNGQVDVLDNSVDR